MENNKNTQRWDMPNFSDQSNDSDDNAECFGKMLIVEEEDDDHMDGDKASNHVNEIRSFEHDDVEFEHHQEDQDDLMDFKEQKLKEIQRIPTPINQFPSTSHEKENNVQRLDSIKDYLKNDN